MILACQKLLDQITKVLGLRIPLPLNVGKNSQIIPYFFWGSPLDFRFFVTSQRGQRTSSLLTKRKLRNLEGNDLDQKHSLGKKMSNLRLLIVEPNNALLCRKYEMHGLPTYQECLGTLLRSIKHIWYLLRELLSLKICCSVVAILSYCCDIVA